MIQQQHQQQQNLNPEDKIVSLANWKRLKSTQRGTRQSVRTYLKLLSFHELINETQEVINEISNGKLGDDVTLISSELMREFQDRADHESNEKLSRALRLMKDQFEANIIKLNDLL
ncbi:hypothetical protein HBN50_11875 [Halobacteriovorax sp. GB3]|uniref:hypothetical protein n=1 Tax=Halobacteriovorax sp. GB3 TaxID=2719615 RepID=UPI0023600D00|nr:hypothetical protein [Halobacteriovorax sp. GB3]MDD0853799.1 hypothetical protein [Halobacteriovorax sp. GB3]